MYKEKIQTQYIRKKMIQHYCTMSFIVKCFNSRARAGFHLVVHNLNGGEILRPTKVVNTFVNSDRL